MLIIDLFILCCREFHGNMNLLHKIKVILFRLIISTSLIRQVILLLVGLAIFSISFSSQFSWMLKPQRKGWYIHHNQEKVQIKAWSDWTLGDRTVMCYVELFYRQETVNISEIKLSSQFWIIGRVSGLLCLVKWPPESRDRDDWTLMNMIHATLYSVIVSLIYCSKSHIIHEFNSKALHSWRML